MSTRHALCDAQSATVGVVAPECSRNRTASGWRMQSSCNACWRPYIISYELFFFFFSSRRRHTRFDCDWSSDVCSSDLQAIEVPMFETVVAYVMVEHLYGETFVPPIETAGYKRILNRWRRPFRTTDGYLAVVPYTDADWRAFFALAGRADLQADPRFRTLESRLANIKALYEELAKIIAGRSSADWLEALDPPSGPAMVVNTLRTLP